MWTSHSGTYGVKHVYQLFTVVFLSPSRKMLEYNLKLSHSHLLPHQSLSII
jgi:hypothetical protein